MLNEQQFYLFGQIQTSQAGVQAYSDTSPLWRVFSSMPYECIDEKFPY